MAEEDLELEEERKADSSNGEDLEDLENLEVGAAGGDSDGDAEGDAGEDEETIGEEYDLDVDSLDFGGNFEDDEDDEESSGKKRLIIIAAASVVGLAVLGGGGWFLFSGEDDKKDMGPPGVPGVPRVVMELPLKGAGRGMLAPPTAGKLGPGGKAGPLKAAPVKAQASGIVVPSVTMSAFAALPDLPPTNPIRTEVDPTLTEQTKTGVLPKIGPNGQKPWKVYARSFSGKDARPRIAIIVTGMGLSRAATEAAISRLPGAVTLAFTPYAQALDDWGSIAHRAGHETLLSLPMESATFPVNDPGPYALQSEVSVKKNLRRLNVVLSRMGGYVGVVAYMGSLFSKDGEKLKPVLETLKSRGLMFVDNGSTKKTLGPKLATQIGVPRAMTDLYLDQSLSKAAINAKLAKLERIARERAAAIAITAPYPLVIKQLSAWLKTLDGKKLVLAPISALADVQFLQ